MTEPPEVGSEPGRDLQLLPKAELHVHLSASMRAATFTELLSEADQAPIDPRGFTTFSQFDAIIRTAHNLSQASPESLRRLLTEMIADASANGVVWLQPHVNPYGYPRLGPPQQVFELIMDAAREAGQQYDVGFGTTLVIPRHVDPSMAVELARFAERHAGRGIHALGLAGDEEAFPPERFAAAFAIARKAGLAAAPHAGELRGPDSVRSAVDTLGACRIAHGIRAVEDPSLIALLADRGISLDVCLTSNRILGVVPELAQHPLPQLLAAGVRCSLGADDPLLLGTSLLDEYRLARTELGLSDAQLASLARTSLETSGAPPPLISTSCARIDDWLLAPSE